MNQFNMAFTTKLVKNVNKHTVLDLIRFTPGGISRVELAQRMDLSKAAMTMIVNDLLDCQIIHEIESRSRQSGRPPIILEVDPTRGHVLGIDLGASHISIILTDLGARIIDEIEVPFNIANGPDACLNQVDFLMKNLLEKNQLGIKNINSIGMGVPGPIDSAAGVVFAPPIMPGWDGFPIQHALENKWGAPISLNNDAELGALGEWAYGVGRGDSHLAYIKVGNGIGAGLLLSGQIYRGATGSAGEIGHLTIEENGPLCDCGNHGCLEALAGGKAIARQAREAIHKGQRTLLSEMGPAEFITARDVTAAARRGDLVSQKIIVSAGHYLGIAIAGLVNLFNPQTVVIGGAVAQIGDLLLQPIRDTVMQRSLQASARTVKINTAILRRHSSGLGAIVQALTITLHQAADQRR